MVRAPRGCNERVAVFEVSEAKCQSEYRYIISLVRPADWQLSGKVLTPGGQLEVIMSERELLGWTWLGRLPAVGSSGQCGAMSCR